MNTLRLIGNFRLNGHALLHGLVPLLQMLFQLLLLLDVISPHGSRCRPDYGAERSYDDCK